MTNKDKITCDHLRLASSVLDLVGGTPLIRLSRLFPDPPEVWGKCEFLNPGGSSKDRMGLALVEEAEKSGDLRPGGLIVEASSGNTAVALAQVAAVRGYRLVLAIPEKMSEEKIRLVRALGAEVVVTPNVPPDHPDHYVQVARRIAKERGGVFLDQFRNPANVRAHERATGWEIVEALGRVDAFVSGAGTGGTLTGVAAALKKANPSALVVLADPEGSAISGQKPRPYRIEGIGDDFLPPLLDLELVDRFEIVSDREAFEWARRTARREGLLVGGSSGAALAAASRIHRELPRGARIVVLLADTGRNYLSKIYDDGWWVREGLGEPPEGVALEVVR